ncbi:MAG TPA: hypothetical protein VLF60_00785 [Candidatus Saccharimonadales bacterium]|nr:hypothetical protein [Candidatus Saccharimonadales bacterium]
MPYFTSGTRMELGDFSFFSQAYEAIRISILHYHQFPWWNPWVAGGVPLYANPQIGVFSIQTLLVFLFGAVVGLKISLALFTFFGYGSMYLLLHRYFKVQIVAATLLSILWVLGSFFVSHLPAHVTFAWYFVAPFFIYLALTIRTWRGGLDLGLAMAVMALAQVHNPFFHISTICGAILGIRLLMGWSPRKELLYGILSAGGVFITLAGHRLMLAAHNVSDFPRIIPDEAAHPLVSVLGIVWPFSNAHTFRGLLTQPKAPFGFAEVTATEGVFAVFAGLLCLLFVAYSLRGKWQTLFKKEWRLPACVAVVGLVFLAIGFGSVNHFAPYALMKHLPVLKDMRVSSRWFLFFDGALLTFIGVVVSRMPQKSFARMAVLTFLCLGIIELFTLNLGYQNKRMPHNLLRAPQSSWNYAFDQTHLMGASKVLPGGQKLPDDGQLDAFYREYEATTFNLGTLQANDALVDLNTKPTPRCGYEKGCELVLSGNAKLTFWSPDKIVFTRTGPGKIKLNMNDSNYFVINGHRDTHLLVAEAYHDFIVPVGDNVQTITIAVQPRP